MDAFPKAPDSSLLSIRPARLEDAPALANLATQLGYPSSSVQVEERLRRVLADPNHCVATAVSGDAIAGWVHAYLCCLVESDPHVEVGGLVIDQTYRGIGIGTKLLEKVEEWARENCCGTVSVRSNVNRQQAHKFYLSRGYKLIKSQHAFRKQL
jgi:GNAT superfamily N-acetyltransferase